MASYLVIASDIIPLQGQRMPAAEVYQLMMDHACWEFPAAAPHLNKLKQSDRVLFYLGGNTARFFAGEAIVAGDLQEITKHTEATFNRQNIPFFHWRLPLRDIQRYPAHRATLDDMMELSFARQKEVSRPYIGLLLRVGLRKLTDQDVAFLRGRVGLAALPG